METVKFDLNSNLFITTLTQFCKDTDITLQSHTSNNTFYIKQSDENFITFNFTTDESSKSVYLNELTVYTAYKNFTNFIGTFDNIQHDYFPINFITKIGSNTIAFGHTEFSSIPTFYITKTNLGNLTVIAELNDTGKSNKQFSNIVFITSNTSTAITSYDLTTWGTIGNACTLFNITIPQSILGEYIRDFYYLLTKPDSEPCKIKLNNNIYYNSGYFAIFDSGYTIKPTVPIKTSGLPPKHIYNEAGQFGTISTGWAVDTKLVDNGGSTIYNSQYLTISANANQTFHITKPINNEGYNFLLFTVVCSDGMRQEYNVSSLAVYSDFDSSKVNQYSGQEGGVGTCYGRYTFTNYNSNIYEYRGTGVIPISESIGSSFYITLHKCDTPVHIYGITMI